MRTRQEIEKELEPLKQGGYTITAGSPLELAQMEVLLDIREMLKNSPNV